MITDSQYRELQKRVNDLEKKLDNISLQLSRIILKSDVTSIRETGGKQAKKDTTKYMLDAKVYCKRRIAYECVRKYVTDHNILTYNDLIKVFPDYLQGSLGVIKPIEDAERYSNAHRRFYFGDDDILVLDGHKYVVCSQWEKKNIDNILKTASDLGFQIQAIAIN